MITQILLGTMRGNRHDKYITLFVVRVPEMSMCVKIYQIMCLKYMQLFVCQLCLNQCATKINKGMDKEGTKKKGYKFKDQCTG